MLLTNAEPPCDFKKGAPPSGTSSYHVAVVAARPLCPLPTRSPWSSEGAGTLPTPLPDMGVIGQVGLGVGPLGVAGAQVHTGVGAECPAAASLPGVRALQAGWLPASPW